MKMFVKLKPWHMLFGITVFSVAAAPVWWRPYNFMPDDAMFYLQIARNIAAGNGSTFNGLMETNGYHPLWMVCCAVLYRVFGQWPEFVVRPVVFSQQLLAFGAVIFFGRSLQRVAGCWAWFGAAIFGIYLLTGMFGSEAHVNAFFCSWALWLVVGKSGTERSVRSLAGVGMVCGLALLARLDNVFFMAGLGLYAAGQEWCRKQSFVRLSVLALAAAFPVMLYLGYNFVTFGHLTPVSGAIKSTFPFPHWNVRQLNLLGRVVSVFALTGLTVPFWKRSAAWLAFVSVGVLLHALYLVVFSTGFVWWSWYYVPGVLVLSAVAGFVAAKGCDLFSARYSRGLAVTALAGMLVLTVARGWVKAWNPNAIDYRNPLMIQPKRSESSWERQMADFLRENLPPGSRILMWDLPGIAAYFSGHHIIPADGLAAGYEFSDQLLSGAANYLQEMKIEFWIGPLADRGKTIKRKNAWTIRNTDGTHAVELIPPLYPQKSAGIFEVYEKNLVADLREVLVHPDAPAVGVWRIQ